ncbi:glycosyl transferase [Mesorhizobium sp. 113-3-9]|uniref:glycosyltransferase n=1 Tax=Mesorhizobium sp. 113-3-9 TaxID=2744517 RepID=UPI0019293323|nr:glycosyltransferase [Mesorhizobium sp. 113-3-9]BCG89171.1 glycosyl transferase [Mesorhizobium sp. 113-3-9]
MRVLFSSMRMTGHIRPLLPYAHTLMKHGHQVLFASPESAGPILRDTGLAHVPFGHPGDEKLGKVWAATSNMTAEEMGRTMVRDVFADLNARAALPGLRETFRTWNPDVIVRESLEFAAAIVAAENGIPVASVATINGLSEAVAMASAVAPVDVLRQEAGLEPDVGAALRATPTFTSFPASLDGDVETVGSLAPFRVRTERESLDPESAVPTWALDDGRPLVFITFGTLAAGSSKNHELFRTALKSVADLPVRALFSTGAEMDRSLLGAVPENVTVEAWVPQREIFPRAAALVCHGGAGTVLAGLANGLPIVLTPLNADQPENARRVEAAGAGIALPNPDTTSLRAAIERALADPRIRAAAGRIAHEIGTMWSIHDAVGKIERLSAG